MFRSDAGECRSVRRAAGVPLRTMVRAYTVALLTILGFALFPVLSVLIVSLVAGAAGCSVNEGSVTPCVIAGVDMGGLLYTMGVLGWLMVATIPVGAMLLAGWLALLLGHLAWRHFRRKAKPIDTPERTDQQA